MLAPSQTVQDLQRARNLIADPEKWCQHALHSDDGGKHCALGAVDATVAYEDRFKTAKWAGDYLEDAAIELFPDSVGKPDLFPVPWVNDALGHDAILRVYDRAIELAMQDIGAPSHV